MKLSWRQSVLAICFVIASSSIAGAVEPVVCKCPMGRDYFLYVPQNPDAGKAYYLIVGAHGYKGTGKDVNLGEWADRGDCIGAAPSFPNGYQILAEETDRQVIGIAQQLSKKYKLFPKMFLLGHSGGGQFVHRFALAHPELVLGCVATSSGSWADTLNPAAAQIPIAIGCGEADNQKSSPQSPYTRIEWAHRFEHLLMQSNFFYTAHFWKRAAATEAMPKTSTRWSWTRSRWAQAECSSRRGGKSRASLPMRRPVLPRRTTPGASPT